MITAVGALGLLAVLFVAIRWGERPALLTAVVSVIALNFFLIEPRFTFNVADPENVVALAVLLIAAIVVGRLAGRSEERRRMALAREREAQVIAGAASALLEGEGLDAQLAKVTASIQTSTKGDLELRFSAAPTTSEDTTATRLPTQTRPAWLYSRGGAGWNGSDIDRVAAPLARLIDFARERERAEAEAAEAEASQRADVAKTALLHATSHDLRTPLTAITAAASGLQSELSDGDRAALLTVIEEEADRLARLVDDLLDVSKIQAGAVNPQTDWCDLRDAALSAAAQVRERHPDHPIEVDLDDQLPLVHADAAQLERVFSNLIENAVKFSPPEEPVRISGGSAGRGVIVRVTDRGRGIPPSKQAQVFEPFFSGRQSESGSGLGLAICRGLVEANGGKIELQSVEGQGTSFTVSFPHVPQPAEAR